MIVISVSDPDPYYFGFTGSGLVHGMDPVPDPDSKEKRS